MIKKIEFQFYLLIIIVLFSGKLFAQSDNEKTKLLILGTAHLSQIKDFDPMMLENVIDKLDTESFNVVCIENMPAELLYDIRSRNDSAFKQLISSYEFDLGISFFY